MYTFYKIMTTNIHNRYKHRLDNLIRMSVEKVYRDGRVTVSVTVPSLNMSFVETYKNIYMVKAEIAKLYQQLTTDVSLHTVLDYVSFLYDAYMARVLTLFHNGIPK